MDDSGRTTPLSGGAVTAATSRLEGQVALVTGAGNGQGAATAELFGREGALVVAADVDLDSARATADAVVAAGGAAVAVQADVSTATGAKAMVEAARSNFGGLHALVNNAGVTLFKSIEEMTEADWDRIMNVDLKGVFLTCRAAVPLMRESGGGSIVNISSTAATKALRNHTAYSAAKAGVLQFTRTLALDVGSFGIRVNCICPGPVDTDGFRRASAQRGELPDFARLPLGRIGRPSEVSSVSLFLCSRDASFMTGATLVVDGGSSTGTI
ncbi:SDR family NAD(P)-dependent oxidoreductase [Parafrankia discariae]|uniref:SDR family NAD(P)-dependent oxidoreductase n=1 Tax=Parafrankia discariae TaxID=365528 RepID=UPI00037D92B2|nr:SDR family NAD(P)-dependent oxidoreductase [Parafrankia discariae]